MTWWTEVQEQGAAAEPSALDPWEPEPHEIDAETDARFTASDAADARKQAEAWEKTDPDYNPQLDDPEAGL